MQYPRKITNSSSDLQPQCLCPISREKKAWVYANKKHAICINICSSCVVENISRNNLSLNLKDEYNLSN